MNTFIKYALMACVALQAVAANNKVVVYWGQNSVGNEGDLRDYCESPSVDIVVVGFVYMFPTAPGSQYPGLNFANHCWKTFDSANPYLLDCADSIGVDITYCQSLGKQVILSFGGAVGPYGFSSDSQATTFATTVWNMFLGGTSSIRPFGTAVFDGVDLDIESGGSAGYAAFISKLRTYFTAQTARTYFISGAPQCVYPDAMMGPGVGTALSDAWFDYVWVQFYNNYCGVNYYPSAFNFNVWAAWARTSVNPNVKVFIGAPGSQDSAGQGYVTAATLEIISTAVSATFPSTYGGMMLWDAGTAKKNGDLASQLASFIHIGASTSIISTPTTPTPTSASATSAAAPVATTGRSKASTSTSSKGSTSTSAAGTSTSTSSKGSTSTSSKGSTSTSSKGTSTSTSSKGTSTSTSATVVTPPASASSTSSSESCTSGYMKCLPDGSYSTCNHGTWGVSQPCGPLTSCSQSGNYIYCLLTPTPTPASSSSPASTGSCTLGTQQCVGSSSFQTCGNGVNGPSWAVTQNCPSGLSCHMSATANNIYCY